MFEICERDASAYASFAAACGAAEIDLASVRRAPSLAFENEIAQPLICAYQVAVWSSLSTRIASPILFAGYSVGELCAYGCTGSISHADTITLACERAHLMNAASASADGMAALRGLTRSPVEALCAAYDVSIAIVNGDDHFIVGGSISGLDALTHDAVEKGASAQRLRVGIASHTPRLAAASEPFRKVLHKAHWSDSHIAVLSGLDGAVVRDAPTAIAVLARQVSTTIRWVDCMDAIVERDARVCLELGPGNALAHMMRERNPDIDTRSIADFRSLDAVVDWVTRAVR